MDNFIQPNEGIFSNLYQIIMNIWMNDRILMKTGPWVDKKFSRFFLFL